MGLFGKKKKDIDTNTELHSYDIDDEYERSFKDHMSFDFVYSCEKMNMRLDRIIRILSNIPDNELEAFMHNNLMIFCELSATIEVYDNATTNHRFRDLCREFYREDENGYRFDERGWIVCYPRKIYEQKRDEFCEYYRKVKHWLDFYNSHFQ